jgi:predicted LPLAT superfamily acyltransferase
VAADRVKSESKNWSGTGRLRGGRWGIWFFLTALRLLGLRLTYTMLVPPAVYFSFVSPDVPATMAYHERIFGQMPFWKRRWLVFRHFLAFGRALLDRTAILAGKTRPFSFAFEGEHHLRDALAEGRGVLLLSAHLGNWEAAGQYLTRLQVPINVAGLDKEAPQIRALLDQASNLNFRLIPLTGSPTDVVTLVAAMRRGEVVAMLGDRSYGSVTARVPFLGGTASFPVGAYVMAALAGAPLVHVFNLREPGGHYHFFGFRPQRLKMPPHDQRNSFLAACASRFAADLESILKRDPLQWYNFYPFWDQPQPESGRLSSPQLARSPIATQTSELPTRP